MKYILAILNTIIIVIGTIILYNKVQTNKAKKANFNCKNCKAFICRKKICDEKKKIINFR